VALYSDDRNVASASMRFLKYFSHTDEIYWCDWSGEGTSSSKFLCGSVMFYKKIFFDHGSLLYPEKGDQCCVEEDLNVLGKLLEAGRVVSYGSGHHYVYVYHEENTYNLSHHMLTLDVHSGKEVVNVKSLLENQELLESSLQSVGFDRSVAVRSLKKVAFTYEPR